MSFVGRIEKKAQMIVFPLLFALVLFSIKLVPPISYWAYYLTGKWILIICGIFAFILFARKIFIKWKREELYKLFIYLTFLILFYFLPSNPLKNIYTTIILITFLYWFFLSLGGFKKENNNQFDFPKNIIFSDGDKLDRIKIAENIYNDLLTDNISHTYGILGEWGSGKTCLMNFVNEEIHKSKKESKLFSAYLDALEANSDEELVAMILRIIKETVKQNYFWYSIFDEMSFNQYINKVRRFYVDSVTFNLLSVASVRVANRACIEDIKRMKNTINSLLDQFDFRNIVIFIDNLDRCSREKIIKMIESFKYFVGLDKIKFVISIDEDIIFNAFEKEYGNLDENKNYSSLFKWIDKTYKLIESHSNIAKKYFYEVSGVKWHEYIDMIIENVHFNPRIFDKIIGKINVVKRLDITSTVAVTIVAVFIKHYDPGFFEIIVKIDAVNSLRNKMAELEKEARLGYKLLRPIYLKVMKIYEDGKIEKAQQQEKKTIKEAYDTSVYQSFLMPFKNLSE